jgi:hypothetical protein
MGPTKMTTDFASYEYHPGSGKTLVSDPNTGQPVEVECDEKTGAAKFPELKPTYRPSADEIESAKKKATQPAAGVPPTSPAPPRTVYQTPSPIAPGTTPAGPFPPRENPPSA